MTDTYVIDTVFKAHDQMTSTVQNVTGRMNLFGRSSVRNFKKATAGALKFKTVLGGVLGANLITAGMVRLRQGIGGLSEEFLDFDQAVTAAAAKWNIERGTKAFEELGTVARDVAAVTPKTAGQAGKGLDFLAMAGFNAKQAMAALPGVTELSISSQTDLAEASDIASDALSSLGLMTKDSIQLTKNLTRVNDVFAKTTTTSNTTLQMLFEGMKEVAPVASGLGVEVEALSAMLGTLANAGIKSGRGGTALRNMYLRLTGGTREVEKVLKKYNIRIADSSGKMRSMIDILDDVRKKTEKLTDKKKQEALTHLFGNRAVASASVLMRAGGKELHAYEKRLENATGASKKLADMMGKSIPNRLAALKSKLIETGFKFIDIFKDKIPGAIDSTIELINNIDVKKISEGFIELFSTIKKYHGLIEAVIATIVIYNTVTKIAAAVQWALNIAMMANPIGVVIGLVTALGLAIYGLIRYGKEVEEWFDNFWKNIAYGFAWTMNMLSGGNIEAVAGKGAAAFFKKEQGRRRAVKEIERRKGYKSVAEKVSEKDINSLVGEGQKTGVFGGTVGEIFSRHGAVADLENERNTEKEQTNKLVQSLLYGQKKSASELNVNFLNAPSGMSYDIKQGKGAPKISGNLGQQ